MDRIQLLTVGLAFSLSGAAAFAQPTLRVPLSDDGIGIVPATVEKPLPHEPVIDRTEADLDRIHAAALFAEGRLFFQREQYEVALQKYERAYHYARAKSVLTEEILPLAYRIGRSDEAVRYLELADDDVEIDPFVIRRLAITLTEQGQLEKATGLYKRMRVADQDAKNISNVVTRFEMGRLYFLQEDYESAAEHFRFVARSLKSPAEFNLDEPTIGAILQHPEITYGVFAETFMQVEQFELAREYFRLANQGEDKAAILHFELARIAHRQKNLATARQHLQAYFDSGQTDAGAQPYYLYYQVLRDEHDSDTSARKAYIDHFEKLFSPEQSDISMGYVLAEQLLLDEQLEKSRELYNKLMRREPLLDGFIGLAKIALLKLDAESFLSVAANTVAATSEMATAEPILNTAAESKEFAKQVIERGIQSPVDGPITVPLVAANLAVMSEQYDAADKLFSRVVSDTENAKADIIAMWGVAMLAHGRNDRAAKVFQSAIDQNVSPDRNAEWNFYLSGAYAMLEEHDSAIASAQACAELGQDSPGFEVRPAWILYLCDRFEESRAAYEKFLAKWSNNYGSPQVRTIVKDARLALSTICAEQNRLDEAVEWLELVLDEFPGDIGTMNDLGYLWADKNEHLERAHRMIRIAVDASPKSAAYRDSLGWVLYRLGRHNEAITELKTAAELGPPDAIILEHLGDALLAGAQVEEAIATWNKALETAESGTNVHSRIQQKLEQQEAK